MEALSTSSTNVNVSAAILAPWTRATRPPRSSRRSSATTTRGTRTTSSDRVLPRAGMVFENHTAGDRVEGDAVGPHIAGIFERNPDLQFRGRRLYARDGLVVSEWTATATNRDGRRVEWDGIDVFPFENGLILPRTSTRRRTTRASSTSRRVKTARPRGGRRACRDRAELAERSSSSTRRPARMA